MPKRTYRRKRRPGKRYGGKRRKTFRKGGYRSRSSARAVSRYTSIIRPITLKPKFMMRKLQWYNTAEIQMGLGNNTSPNGTTIYSTVPLYGRLRLNSPYMVSDLSKLTAPLLPNPGGLYNGYNGSFRWNDLMTAHTSQSPINTGTAYEGWGQAGSPAYGYAQWCVMGTKVTISYTPVGNRSNAAAGEAGGTFSNGGAQPTAMFGFLQTAPDWNDLNQEPRGNGTQGVARTKIKDIYQKPYCKVRKILPTKVAGGNSGDVSYAGGATSTRMVFKYSPKRMNGIKDIGDNGQLWGAIAYDNPDDITIPRVTHPAESDWLTFGFLPIMDDNPDADTLTKPQVMQSGILQIKMETIIAFREPINGKSEIAMGNTAPPVGGFGGGAAAFQVQMDSGAD